MYGVLPYFLSRNLIEVPYMLLMPFLFILIFYWMIGLASTAEQFFVFYLINFLVGLCGNSFGLLLGSIITDGKSLSSTVTIVLLPFVLFSGFFKNAGNFSSWVGWIQYLSPIKYGFAAMIENEVKYRDSNINSLNLDVGVGLSIGVLFGLAMFFRMLSLFFLWFMRSKMQ